MTPHVHAVGVAVKAKLNIVRVGGSCYLYPEESQEWCQVAHAARRGAKETRCVFLSMTASVLMLEIRV